MPISMCTVLAAASLGYKYLNTFIIFVNTDINSHYTENNLTFYWTFLFVCHSQ